MSSQTEMIEMMNDLGITKKLHQKRVIVEFEKLKNDIRQSMMVHSSSFPSSSMGLLSGHSMSMNHPANDSSKAQENVPPQIEVIERISRTPRSLMTEILTIQGIHLDPSDLDAAVSKIVQAVGRERHSPYKYDCFINYRVASDSDVAEKLYLYLQTHGFKAFLDKKCLLDCMSWRDGFLEGLRHSRKVICLISRAGLAPVRDPTRDHSIDNVLLEYETALRIKNSSRQNSGYICPVLVGSIQKGVLTKFTDFSTELYPDSIEPISHVPVPVPTHSNHHATAFHHSAVTYDSESGKLKCPYNWLSYHSGNFERNIFRPSAWNCCDSPYVNDSEKGEGYPGCIKRPLTAEEKDEIMKGCIRLHPKYFNTKILRKNAWGCCNRTNYADMGCRVKSMPELYCRLVAEARPLPNGNRTISI